MRKLRIKNIKSFKDSGEIEFKPITIFVGKNSCGKSSLIRFPVVLAQTFTSNTDSSLMFYGRMIDYGNYDDVVFKSSEEGIHFEVHYDIDINNTQDSRFMMFENQEALEKLKESMNKEDKDIRDVSIRATINNKNKRTYVEKVELFIENNCLVGFYKEDKVNRIELNYIREDNELIPEQYIMFAEKLTYDGFFPFYDMRDIFSDIVGIVLYGDASQADLEKGQEMYNKLYSMANPFGDEDLDENEKKIKIVKEGATCRRGQEYCILFYSEKKDNYLQNIGYLGEQLDLYLVSKNIGTLWFGIGKVEEKQLDGLDFVIMIAIAKVDKEDKFRKDMYKSKRKDLSEIWQGDAYLEIANIVRFAPSACNTQPWLVEASKQELKVYRYRKEGKRGIMPKDMVIYYNQIDVGIFLCFLDLCLEKNNIQFNREILVEEDHEAEKNLTAIYKI